jgi:hypothetical protein
VALRQSMRLRRKVEWPRIGRGIGAGRRPPLRHLVGRAVPARSARGPSEGPSEQPWCRRRPICLPSPDCRSPRSPGVRHTLTRHTVHRSTEAASHVVRGMT